MKRPKVEPPGARGFRLSQFLLAVAALYLVFITVKFPKILEIASMLSGNDIYDGMELGVNDVEVKTPMKSTYKDTIHMKIEDNQMQEVPLMPHKEPLQDEKVRFQHAKSLRNGYGRITGEILRWRNRTSGLSALERMVEEAWTLGLKAWEEVKDYDLTDMSLSSLVEGNPEVCPSWVSMGGEELAKEGYLMLLPCGLTAGSSITVVGTPHHAHQEYVHQLAKKGGNPIVMVSQFSVELQGLKAVEGEAPPKILHLNPRLRGDWSHHPVIEHNTCYRMQWGTAQRCDGSPTRKDNDMLIDGYKRCEKWMRDDILDSKESKTTSWFRRFIGREQKPEVTWSYPFSEGKMFVLTVRAGIEGYHINVRGQHVTSFAYRTGFTLEDATGLAVKGDVDIHFVYATSLPTSHPSFSSQLVLEMLPKWKAHPLPKNPVRLFIGILSATNHFAERMAVRKTWMQSPEIRSSAVTARFFVALNPRKEVNAVLKKEAAYFGDIVILPFMDRYELVVLKTIAICEFGVQNVTAAHIMKCDDDTFVRIDTVLRQIARLPAKRTLYMGNLNLLHRPLRHGKWAVTYEEWPEAVYPPYANGPAYIISIDVAQYVISQHTKNSCLLFLSLSHLFKMEDVSMGMWVEQFNSSNPVQYSHNWKFCQYGCMEGYFTAHYQSPRQMICLWANLERGQPRCCNFR